MIVSAPHLSPLPFRGGVGGGASRVRPTVRLYGRASRLRLNAGMFGQASEHWDGPHPNPSPEGEGLYGGDAQKLLDMSLEGNVG